MTETQALWQLRLPCGCIADTAFCPDAQRLWSNVCRFTNGQTPEELNNHRLAEIAYTAHFLKQARAATRRGEQYLQTLSKVTLTEERILEASPIEATQKKRLQKDLALYKGTPYGRDIIRQAWLSLHMWFVFEAKEIGEVRAFWGLVYRLLDNPTADDIKYISTSMHLDLQRSLGFYRDPTKIRTISETDELHA